MSRYKLDDTSPAYHVVAGWDSGCRCYFGEVFQIGDKGVLKSVYETPMLPNNPTKPPQTVQELSDMLLKSAVEYAWCVKQHRWACSSVPDVWTFTSEPTDPVRAFSCQLAVDLVGDKLTQGGVRRTARLQTFVDELAATLNPTPVNKT